MQKRSTILKFMYCRIGMARLHKIYIEDTHKHDP